MMDLNPRPSVKVSSRKNVKIRKNVNIKPEKC